MDRGSFFHEVYRIEQKLGRTFRELEPFALFPLDEYFGNTTRKELPAVVPFPVQTEPQTVQETRRALKFPVKEAA